MENHNVLIIQKIYEATIMHYNVLIKSQPNHDSLTLITHDNHGK